MDWILGHIQVVFALAAAAAYALSAKKASAKDAARRAAGAPVTGADERTCGIQDEIRRKIAARRGEPAPPAPAPAAPPRLPSPLRAPRPVAQDLPRLLRERLARKLEQARAEAEEAAERLRRSREELRADRADEPEAGRLREAAPPMVVEEAVVVAVAPPSVAGGEMSWRGMLRDPQSVRQAMVLREILGPPVALR